MQNLIFGPALFYDLPEYLQIVGSHSFWQVFSLGHFPIHPIFMGILWLLTRGLPVNAIAMLFGILSIFIFYKISKLIFKTGPFWISTIIFVLLPAVWIINTNLMVESVTLTFFLSEIYFFIKKQKILFLISFFLMIGTHLESVFWIPVIFLIPPMFEVKFKKDEFTNFVKLSFLSVLLSATFYLLLYYFSGRTITGSTEQLSVYFSSNIFQMIRNIWLSFIRDFDSLTPFVLGFLLLKYIKSRPVLIAWIIFFGLVALVGANWQGDFMGRRIIFAAVPVALALYKYLRIKSVLIVLYLLPIIAANVVLYSGSSPFVTPNIPTGQVLIETHYLKPFTKYDGTILWIGESDLRIIDSFLKNGTRVFMTKQSVTAPYQLLVGQNYHITSLGRVGDSESRFLFKKYEIDSFNNVFEIKTYKGKISDRAGEPVIFFDQSFWGRLARRRIDYGDAGSWIWAIATNHRDPAGWTYDDVRGISVTP